MKSFLDKNESLLLGYAATNFAKRFFSLISALSFPPEKPLKWIFQYLLY